MKKLFLIGAVALACMAQAKTITLDVANPLNPDPVEYDAEGVWTETFNEDDYYTIDYDGMYFNHFAMTDYDFWCGFTITKSAEKTGASVEEQFRCVAGGGLAGEGTPFLLAFAMEGMGPLSPAQVYFDDAAVPQEVYVCQATWTMDNILNGGGAARKFVEGDTLAIIVEGLDANGDLIENNRIVYYLADFRDTDHDKWILNEGWDKIDLTALGEVNGLVFTMATSDRGSYGANTATYFALDGLKIKQTAVATFENEAGGINLVDAESNWFGADEPANEWNSWTSGDFNFKTYYTPSYKSAWVVTNETSTEFASWSDAYRSAAGGAFDGDNFVVWNLCYYGTEQVTFEPQVVKGFFVNNNSYAVNSMCNGDASAKKFENTDWFKLTITGYKEGAAVETVDFMLAENGKYVNQWTYVDLTTLGEIDAVQFSMSSTDNGDWGMNTPAYFAMDNFGAAMPDGYVAPEMAEFPKAPAAIDNTENAVSAEKVIRDGQLFILRNGVMYNINGAVVK